MKSTRRIFVPARQRSRANAVCPCGKNNKDGKFATQKGYEGQPVGSCHSCGKDYWPDNSTLVDPANIVYEPPKPKCNIDQKHLHDHFDENLDSVYAKNLIERWGPHNAEDMVSDFHLGVYKAAPIFWYIDTGGTIRHGKIQWYNSNGKRNKNLHATTFQSLVLELKDERRCEIDWCFFGEHNLVNIDRPVSIVEAEATAIEMSKLIRDEIWLATGGRGFLKKMAHRLINCPKDVKLYPDHEAYDEWKEVGDQYGWFTSHLCEEWFKEGSIPKGGDIRDYYRLNINDNSYLNLPRN
jgi:hypothetical protein